MRSIILGLSVIIIVVLGLITYIYQTQETVTLRTDEIQQTELEDVQQSDPLYPVTDEQVSYSLQEEALHLTYNEGVDWIEVPIEKDALFAGEYQGNQTELIESSFVLTKDRAAFLYSEPIDQGSDLVRVGVKETSDQGETWEDHIVVEEISPIRFRKLGFVNDTFGYVILSMGRTMSQEYSAVYVTEDGGENWQATTELPSTRMIGFGGFVDEVTGFLSYGTINPEEPDVYVTQDMGETWIQSQFQIPEEYERIFVQAEVPIKEEDHLSVLVNQGPNGDYKGGIIKGKFISKDNGVNWQFLKEVEPSETE